MGYRVQDSFAYNSFIKGGYLFYEETLLIMLDLIAEIDGIPQLVEYVEEPLTELQPLLVSNLIFGGTVFEYDLGLRQAPAKAGSRPK